MIDLTKNDTMAPLVTMTIADGVVDGKVTDLPAVADERSNLAIIYMNSKESFNCELTHKKLIPGYTRQLDWDLNVIDKDENARAVISFIDRCGNDTTIVYDYNPIKLEITPKEYDFGHVRVKEGKFWVAYFMVHNVAELGAFMLDSLSFQNSHPYLTLYTENIPVELQPGDSVRFNVFFSPNESCSFVDSVGAGSENKHWFKASVKGSAGSPLIKVADIEFPDSLLIGKSAYNTGEVTNIGDYDLEVYSWSMTESAGFSAEFPEMSPAHPIVIKPEESFVYEVTFSPTAEGDHSGQIAFSSSTSESAVIQPDSLAILFGIGKKKPISVDEFTGS
jgi:hypothetical protein